MCGSADSTATIKGNTTLEQEKKLRKDSGLPPPTTDNSAAAAVEHAMTSQGFSIAPPPDAPDLTDALLRQRRASEVSRLTSGRGRRDSFLGGGDSGGFAMRSSSTLGGY